MGRATSRDRPRTDGYLAALRVPLVRRLTGATTASVIGDYLGVGALLVMAADRTGGSAVGAAAVFAAAVPMTVLVGVVGGRYLDRLPRVPALVAFELLGAALICLPLLVDGVAVVYVAAALLAGQRTATGAIRQGVIAVGVQTRHRAPLIALTNTIDQGAQVVGYATGAAIYLLISPSAALLLDAASFVVAALVLLGIGRHLPTADAEASAATESPEATRVAGDRALTDGGAAGPAASSGLPGGATILYRDPVLRMFAALVLVTATVAALPETLAPIVLDGEDARAALLLASAPLGQAVTLAALGRTAVIARPSFQLRHLAGLAVALAVAATSRGVTGLIVANLLVGAGVAWILGPQLTFLRLVPAARMAQVTGLMWAVIAVAEGGGAVVFGALADRATPRTAYLFGGVLIAVTAAVATALARRSDAVATLEERVRAEEAAT